MNIKKLLAVLIIAAGLVPSVGLAASEGYGVLTYHDVVDESKPRPAATDKNYEGKMLRQYYPQTITIQKLIEHFNWLKVNGYQPVSWQQIVDARNGKSKLPSKPVLLTFDDGYESFYTIVFPLLKSYRYPAVFALVTSWQETPMGQFIDYGNQKLPRSAFVSWEQTREMHRSGLVEIASHTHDLHKSMIGNSAGTLFAAALSGRYVNGRHETEAEYKQRIHEDFRKSSQVIQREVGAKPRVLVWPYGQFNETAVKIAREEGFESDFTLLDETLNDPNTKDIGRQLLDQETDFGLMATYLNEEMFDTPVKRVVHVDLDYVYDADPKQQLRNVDKLIQRIHDYKISTVYLQAYADQDGDGVAEAVYFPSKHIKMRGNLFSWISWQLMTRADVEVYAWMPMMAFDLGKGYEYVKDARTNEPNKKHYLRLSPYDRKSRETVTDIYRELAFSSRFTGILFHDDGFLTDFEGNIAQGKRSDAQYMQEAKNKTNDLISYSDELKNAVYEYVFNGRKRMKTARNIYASVVMQPESEKWFAQNLPLFAKHYDYVAVMAMPYMEAEGPLSKAQARDWLKKLTKQVKKEVPLEKTLFELQAMDWKTKKPIDSTEMVTWINDLKQAGVQNIGYYPDDFLNNHPDFKTVYPHFSSKR